MIRLDAVFVVILWINSPESSALELGRNQSDPNELIFFQSEHRKSNSCPDPSLITAFLQMASMLDSEEDLLINRVSPSSPREEPNSSTPSESPKKTPLQQSAQYKPLHDPLPFADPTQSQILAVIPSLPPPTGRHSHSVRPFWLNSSRSSAIDAVSKSPMHRFADSENECCSPKGPPPLGEQEQPQSRHGYPQSGFRKSAENKTSPLGLQQQLLAVRELPESARSHIYKYPSHWALFMILFGRWMATRPQRGGLSKNQFEFSISGFDAAKMWSLTVHLDWTSNPKNQSRPNNRARTTSRWVWRQVGWMRFVSLQPNRQHDGVTLNDKIPIQWRIQNCCSGAFDWVIMVRGWISKKSGNGSPSDWFHFCISKSVPSDFLVHISTPKESSQFSECRRL